MGFKFKRIDLVNGTSEFPVDSSESYSGRLFRSKTIMRKFKEAILNAGCGWQLDSTRTDADEDGFVGIPNSPGTENFPGLFFVNQKTGGAKLFICHMSVKTNVGIKNFSGNDVFCMDAIHSHSTNESTQTGTCVSIIPEGSDSVFGDPTTSTFLPADATRIVATVNGYANDYASVAYKTYVNFINSYGLFINENTIALSIKRKENEYPSIGVPVFATGKVFGSLAHSTDIANSSHYGTVLFRECSVNWEGNQSRNYLDSTPYGNNSRNFIGISTTSNLSSLINSTKISACFTNTNGNWINGSDRAHYNTVIYPSDTRQLSSAILSGVGSGKSRWCPFAVAVISDDPSTYCVANGDGFKGYLNTDLFRCAIGAYGQTYDNGNFICCDSAYNFLIGWDPSNTDQLAGDDPQVT